MKLKNLNYDDNLKKNNIIEMKLKNSNCGETQRLEL